MRLLLAPMEGLLDHPLREVLTRLPGVDRCVSEFVRITDQLLPERVWTRIVPELLHGSRTQAGTPVRPQLLGSDPACLADNAAIVASLGAEGVDLNFGCPARTVNRHRGGAVLLDEPELVFRIVRAVRRTLPPALPLSAKMRLGTRDASRLLDNVQAIVDGGAGEIVVHARTKQDGYRPPAHWDQIARVREAAGPVAVVANGEIWSVADAHACLAASGCDALMLGRGAVADPGLAAALRDPQRRTGWAEVLPLVRLYWTLIAGRCAPVHRPGRLKQWLNLLRRRHPGAQQLYDRVRAVAQPAAIEAMLDEAAPVQGSAPVGHVPHGDAHAAAGLPALAA